MIRNILAWYISICAALVLIIQGLSILHAIALGPLLLCVTAVALIALAVKRPHLAIPRKVLWPRLLHPLTLPFLIGLPLIAGISFALGWHMPPNNWDSMTYHLSRAAYWRQWRTLAHFPSNYWAQNANPGNAEVLLLVTLLLAHSAKLAFLVQFSAYLSAAAAVYGLTRQLGGRPVYAVAAAGMFATMPEVVLQSITPQNDLIAAAFTVCAVYFLVETLQKHRYSSILLCGAALGLGVGTKPTAFFVLPGISIGLLALFWSRRPACHITSRGVATISAALLLITLLGAPWYIANKAYYGNFTGPPAVTQVEDVSHPSLETLRVNLTRYIVGLIDPEGPAMLSATSAAAVCNHTAELRVNLVTLAHLPQVEPAVEWAGLRYNPMPTCFFNEDLSWYGIIGFVVAAVALAWGIVGIARREAEWPWIIAVGTMSSLVCLALLLRWSPWQQRLLITTLALGSPLLGILAQRLWPRPLGRTVFYIAVLYTVGGGLTAATHNGVKPLALWNANQTTAQTLMRPEMKPILEQVARTVPQNAHMDAFLNVDDWDFPLFGPRLNRFIEPLVLPSKPGYNKSTDKFQWILTHQSNRAVLSLFGDMRSMHCRRTWTTETTGPTTVPWNLYECTRRVRHMSSEARKPSVRTQKTVA